MGEFPLEFSGCLYQEGTRQSQKYAHVFAETSLAVQVPPSFVLSAKKTAKQDQPEATLDAETPMVELCNVRVFDFQDSQNSESFCLPVQVIKSQDTITNSVQSFYPSRVSGGPRYLV